MSVIHVFNLQIFRAAPQPPFTPTVLSSEQGLGSSGSFQPEAVSLVVALAFEAVRISVKSDNLELLGAISGIFFS
jgi:hypothetical protein